MFTKLVLFYKTIVFYNFTNLKNNYFLSNKYKMKSKFKQLLQKYNLKDALYYSTSLSKGKGNIFVKDSEKHTVPSAPIKYI